MFPPSRSSSAFKVRRTSQAFDPAIRIISDNNIPAINDNIFQVNITLMAPVLLFVSNLCVE